MRSKLRLGLLQESFADEPFDFDVDHLRVLLVRFAAKQDFKSATTGVAAKAMRNELNALVSGIDDPAVRKVSLLLSAPLGLLSRNPPISCSFSESPFASSKRLCVAKSTFCACWMCLTALQQVCDCLSDTPCGRRQRSTCSNCLLLLKAADCGQCAHVRQPPWQARRRTRRSHSTAHAGS